MPDDVFDVPPDGEDVLRTMYRGDTTYTRQASLGLARPFVTLVGCGGVGAWIALSLVLGGVEYLNLYDGDTLSTNNLNRFPLPELGNIGEMKSLALAKWLTTLRPQANITARGQFDPELHRNVNTDWLVCATDSLKSRKMCYEYSKLIGTRYLEVGADGERWTLSPSPPEFSTELEDNPGYQTVPVHVGPCMMGGAAAAYYILHNQVPTHSLSGDWTKYSNIRSMGLRVNEMSEVPNELFRCKSCGWECTGSLIDAIRHLREELTIGILEAKYLAEDWIANPTTLWDGDTIPMPHGRTRSILAIRQDQEAVDAAIAEAEATNPEDEGPLLDEHGEETVGELDTELIEERMEDEPNEP